MSTHDQVALMLINGGPPQSEDYVLPNQIRQRKASKFFQYVTRVGGERSHLQMFDNHSELLLLFYFCSLLLVS